MHSLLLALTLAATPSVKLAAPGLNTVGMTDTAGNAVVEYLADQLRGQGLSVTTRSQISALLGFERQKQLLGCGESSASCLAELAGALGVQGIITGSINRTRRGTFIVTVTVVDARDGRTVASASERTSDEDGLYDFLGRFARENGPRILQALAPAPRAPAEPAATRAAADGPATSKAAPSAPPPTSAPIAHTTPPLPMPPPPKLVPTQPTHEAPPEAVSAAAPGPHPGWIVAGVGGAALLASGVIFGLAIASDAQLKFGQAQVADRTDLAQQLQAIDNQQKVAFGLAVGGALAAGGGTVWALLPAPTVAVRSNSASLQLAWVLQ